MPGFDWGGFKGFSNIYGEDYQRLLAEGRVLSDARVVGVGDSFSPYDEVAEAALDQYIPMVDSWHQSLKDIPDSEDKQAMVMRMGKAVYFGGMRIHPTKDGNRQTFIGMTLSYLHDLAPNLRDKFFPIKYGSGDLAPRKTVGIMGPSLGEENNLTTFEVPNITPRNERDRLMVDYIFQAHEINRRTPYIEGESIKDREDKIESALMGLAKKASLELQIPAIAEKHIYRYEESRKYLFFKKRFPVYSSQIISFINGCREYLLSQGYPREQVNVTAHGSGGQKVDRASHAVRQLFTTDEGKQLLNDFVWGKEIVIADDDPNNKLWRKTLGILERQKQNFLDTLESREDHVARHHTIIAGQISPNAEGLAPKT